MFEGSDIQHRDIPRAVSAFSWPPFSAKVKLSDTARCRSWADPFWPMSMIDRCAKNHDSRNAEKKNTCT